MNERMKTNIQAYLPAIALVLCLSCSSPFTNNKQPIIHQITMAATSAGILITFDDKGMSLNDIAQILSTENTTNRTRRVLLLVDPKVSMAEYFNAMDMLQKLGMDDSVAVLKWGNPEQSANYVDLKRNNDLFKLHTPQSTNECTGTVNIEIK